MSTNQTKADLWNSSTANSPDNARVYRATIAPLDLGRNNYFLVFL